MTHGGITTINECVEMAVPMVVYSTHFVDQDGCAVRVEHHGLGVVGDKETDGVADIERRIAVALDDPTIARAVRAMQAVFSGYRERADAVRRIERAGTVRGGT